MEERAKYGGVGWHSDLATFHSTSPRVIRGNLVDFIRDAGIEQIRAWDQSIPWLQREYRDLETINVESTSYTTILEYELPRDLRRPDVIVLESGTVVVLELKGRPNPTQAAIDQVAAYARDLSAYHSACAETEVVPVLVVGQQERAIEQQDGVTITSPVGLASLLDQLAKPGKQHVKVEQFLRDDAYTPLPSIVAAARELFHNRPLPMIKRARAATEPALEYISAIAHEAAKTKTRHLVLLSGVPGSGKTLVGLQLVHAHWLDDLAVARGEQMPTAAAVYLSGNGPLVQVLQHALRDGGGGGRTFVQDIKTYVRQHSNPRNPIPPEHLIVFDEAQRAHDADRVAHVHNTQVDKSEPEHLIDFCSRIPEWCVLVALIGDGQAIHVGEEGGIELWSDAIRKSPKADEWTVHACPAFKDNFATHIGKKYWSEQLNLDTEIRFHLTPKVHEFVDGLLTNKPAYELRQLAEELNAGGHRFLVTRELDTARLYLHERYADAKLARYGLVASSKDKWLNDFSVDNTFQTTKRLKVGPWYNADPSDPQSCCQLETVVTEFSSQGLELDCALLAWGSDLLWQEDSWSIQFSRGSRPPLRDPLSVRKNVYRVLMTRGRDGTVIYVPCDTRFDSTYDHLIECGMRALEGNN